MSERGSRSAGWAGTLDGPPEWEEYGPAADADFNVRFEAQARDVHAELDSRRGADVNAAEDHGLTPLTAELLKALGANPRLGIPGTVHERLRLKGYWMVAHTPP